MQYAVKGKGKHVAVLEGYTFYRARETKTTVSWECTMHGQRCGCKARFTTQCGGDRHLIRANTHHTHDPPAYKIIDGIYHKIYKQISRPVNGAAMKIKKIVLMYLVF